MGRHKFPDYNKRHSTSVNLDETTLVFLKWLKKEKFVKSVSQAVREIIQFSLPYFLSTVRIINGCLDNTINKTTFTYKKPEPLSNEELRKLYPTIKDFKFINED